MESEKRIDELRRLAKAAGLSDLVVDGELIEGDSAAFDGGAFVREAKALLEDSEEDTDEDTDSGPSGPELIPLPGREPDEEDADEEDDSGWLAGFPKPIQERLTYLAAYMGIDEFDVACAAISDAYWDARGRVSDGDG